MGLLCCVGVSCLCVIVWAESELFGTYIWHGVNEIAETCGSARRCPAGAGAEKEDDAFGENREMDVDLCRGRVREWEGKLDGNGRVGGIYRLRG